VSRSTAPRVDPRRFLQKPSDGRRFDDELECVIFVGRYGHRHRRVRLVLLSSRVKILAKGHEVETVWPRAGPTGGAGRAPPAGTVRRIVAASGRLATTSFSTVAMGGFEEAGMGFSKNRV
jgi:hypothetical protein